MKKIIIVNDNLHLGGIQKSLINLLKSVSDEYEITLLLLNKEGDLLSETPDNVKIITACKLLSVLGAYKKELKHNAIAYIWKGILLLIAKSISKALSFRIAGLFQKKIGKYDVAISYSHPSTAHNLRSCSAEFVLDKIIATEKVCFVHGDYQNEVNRCDYTDALYKLFDRIACCSESVKRHFTDALPDLEEKTYTVRNFYDLSLIHKEDISAYIYDDKYINIVSVARLTSEKGIERAIEALYESGRKDIRYYVVGDGPEREKIEHMLTQFVMSEQVFLMGESSQPYTFMKNADYLLVPSYHEAAPMVFDEAKLLGLNIITTNTTSAVEMVENDGGIVCDNSTTGITSALLSIEKPFKSSERKFNNEKQRKQLEDIFKA